MANNCMEFRLGNILSLKLFDPWIVQETGDIILLDSDVLFFRRPTELLHWLDHPEERRNCWNRQIPHDRPVDDGPEYGSQVDGAQGDDQPPMVGFNSGIGFLKRELMSFQTVEDLLSGERRETSKWLIEQELYGRLSAMAGMEALPATYNVPSWRSPPPHALVAKHYVGLVRGFFIGEGIWWILNHPDPSGVV